MKNFITSLAKKAGKELLKNFQKDQGVRFKDKHNIVTKADLLAEKIIISAIKKKFPGHSILSEERGLKKKSKNYLWIIDPLDGTTNYVLKNPLFAINIALVQNQELQLGLVYIPVFEEVFWAERKKGATLNNKKIKVSQIKNLKYAFLTYCHGYQKRSIQQITKIYQAFKLNYFDLRQLGSAGIELCWVACGRTDAYLAPGLNLWDAAAGTLIVREAGGKVTDFSGNDWVINSVDLVATNSLIHKKLLKAIKKVKV